MDREEQEDELIASGVNKEVAADGVVPAILSTCPAKCWPQKPQANRYRDSASITSRFKCIKYVSS